MLLHYDGAAWRKVPSGTAQSLRAGDEVSTQVLTRPGRYKTVADKLRVKEVWVGEGERRRRYVLCHNP